MAVQGIKLVTGEELIAGVQGATPDGRVTVRQPLVVHVNQSKDGLVCNFFPWTIIADGDITLEPAGIVARYTVPGDVEAAYIQNTTGLQIVSGGTQILHS